MNGWSLPAFEAGKGDEGLAHVAWAVCWVPDDDASIPSGDQEALESLWSCCSIADTFLGPFFQLLLLLGPKAGSRRQYPRLARACLCLEHLIAFGLPPPSSLPSQWLVCWETHLSSCDPVVSKAKSVCLVSALTVGSEAFPCPGWCLPHMVPDTGLLHPHLLLLWLPFP